jgi:hypothetical protein
MALAAPAAYIAAAGEALHPIRRHAADIFTGNLVLSGLNTILVRIEK